MQINQMCIVVLHISRTSLSYTTETVHWPLPSSTSPHFLEDTVYFLSLSIRPFWTSHILQLHPCCSMSTCLQVHEFICLIDSPVKSFSWIFQSIYWILKLWYVCLVLFKSVLSPNVLIFYMDYFPDFIQLSICVVVKYLTSIRWLLWILCQVIHRCLVFIF